MIKILLVEDNENMRENTAEILELANYKVITASNGKEGVELAQREHPDLIVCDIMMPVLDGYGVLHLLSKNSSTASIPFIFLTAKTERNDFRKGMEMGADDYLTKPFDDIELLSAIEVRLKKSGLFKNEFAKSKSGLAEFWNGAKSITDLKKLSASYPETLNFNKKDNIYKEGGYPRGLYFITKGRVKVSRTHELGRELITGLYKEGDFFGYLALLEETTYSEIAESMDETELCFIPKADFFELMFTNLEVSRAFIKMLSDNLLEKEEHLVKLAYNSVRKRVAEALVTLYERYKTDENKGFEINISRENLASIAGTATETTIRSLSNFKDEGLIAINGSTIVLLNLESLMKMRS